MPYIKELTISQVREIYDSRMKKDFPPDELRPYRSIEQLTQEGLYFSLGYFDGETLLAYALFAKPKDSGGALLDYYAVSEEARGTGIGSKFLSGFHTVLEPHHVTHIILEVEAVDTAGNNAEKEIRERRIRFYKRCLCKMSGIRSALFGVDYQVMYLSFDGRVIPDKAIAHELRGMYRLILSPILKTEEDFQKNAVVYD